MKKHLPFILIFFGVIFSSPVNAQTPVQIAGTGQSGYNGNNLPALVTELNNPTGIAFDKKGLVYFSDADNQLIRKIDASGNIVTVAGLNGVGGYNGDGIAATSAELSFPAAIAFDSAGNLYIADQGNERIRKVDTAGIITTVVGNGTSGYNGDSILAVSAEIFSPSGIAFDAGGNMYITEQNESRVRKINTSGYISTVIGNGTQGYTGDNGIDTNAQMDAPYGICFDNTGNMYVTDIGNGTVRKVNTAGIITTVAGTGVSGYNGDGIAATDAELQFTEGVTVDGSGNIYIADGSNDRICEINTKGIINTLVSDTGQIIDSIGFETAVNIDGCGNLYFIDGTNAVIWRLGTSDTAENITPQSPSICSGQSISLVASGGGITYDWSPATGLNTTTGDTVVAKPLVTTSYTLTVYSNGCVKTNSDVVTVIPSPNKPSFTQHNDTLISNSRYDNQWYRNDSLLVNDTSQDLIISVLGEYCVVVNNEANGCSTSSDSITISSLTAVNQLSARQLAGQLSIYPNPTSGQFTLKLNDNKTNYSVAIYNVLGEEIYQSVLKSPLGDLGVINLSAQPDGMYFVYLKSDESVGIEKILITK